MDAPYANREEHVLRDGTHVTLRPIEPEDADELRVAFARLSPRSRHQRFLGGVLRLTDEMARYLTEVDGVNHAAIVATKDSLDLKDDVGVGVARFVRLPDEPGVAEAAVTVVDEMQGRGVGRLLLEALARLAHERGIHTLRGVVLAENVQMRRLLDEAGATVRDDDEGALTVDVPLNWVGGDLARDPEHPMRRLLRALASLAHLRRASAHADAGT